MSEEIALGALGGAALTEGIKFLYAQAGELLNRRRDAGASAERTAAEEELIELRDRLAPYVDGDAPVGAGDEALIRSMEDLRLLLERLTGERGAFTRAAKISGHAEAGQITGDLVGVELAQLPGAQVHGTARAEEAHGRVIGVRVDGG